MRYGPWPRRGRLLRHLCFSSSFPRVPNPGGARPCQGGTHCGQWGGRWRPALTWPRRDYIALLEEEEKRRSNRQPFCGCQGPATAALTPASGRALRGRSTRPATGARQHTARQSKTARPTLGAQRRTRGVGARCHHTVHLPPPVPQPAHAVPAIEAREHRGLECLTLTQEPCGSTVRSRARRQDNPHRRRCGPNSAVHGRGRRRRGR